MGGKNDKPLLLSKPFAHLTFRHMQDHGVARTQVGVGTAFDKGREGHQSCAKCISRPARQKVLM